MIDEVDKKVMGDILTHGWSCVGVFPTEEAPGVYFSYTAGLNLNYSHPELAVMGISLDRAHQLLAIVVERIQGGEEFTANTFGERIMANHRAAFVEVSDLHHPEYPFSMATRLQGEGIEALQLIWPDQEDRFPWQDDFDPKFKAHQPLLGTWKGDS